MIPIKFPEQNVVYAKNHPKYLPLPAHKNQVIGKSTPMTCCWKLTWRERLKVLFTGILWHQVLTFNTPLQPQKILVDKPDMEIG